LASAHEGQSPVVSKGSSHGVLHVVGMSCDEEVSVVEVSVAADDLGDLREDLFPLGLQLVSSRVEKDVARELDDEAVVARHALDAKLIELVELRPQLAKPSFDDRELVGALLVLGQRLRELLSLPLRLVE